MVTYKVLYLHKSTILKTRADTITQQLDLLNELGPCDELRLKKCNSSD